jgi:hypothetical protein
VAQLDAECGAVNGHSASAACDLANLQTFAISSYRRRVLFVNQNMIRFRGTPHHLKEQLRNRSKKGRDAACLG